MSVRRHSYDKIQLFTLAYAINSSECYNMTLKIVVGIGHILGWTIVCDNCTVWMGPYRTLSIYYAISHTDTETIDSRASKRLKLQRNYNCTLPCNYTEGKNMMNPGWSMYRLNHITLMFWMWELWEIFMDDRWTFAKVKPQKNDFYAPDWDRTHKLMIGEMR